MKLMNCPSCGNEVSDQAVTCPKCGHPLKKETQPQVKKKKGRGCLITIVAVIAFFAIMAIIAGGVFGGNKAIQKGVSGVSDENEYITMKEYNSIETGMSYDQVKEIVGSSGEVTSQVDSYGIKIMMITWYGNGMVGSNANVTFTNDEVSGKAQIGLK